MPTGVYERKLKPNDYEYVDENTIAIIINSPKYGIKKILIDAEDYDKVKAHKWRWFPRQNRASTQIRNPTICVRGSRGRHRTSWIHRIIMNCPKGMVVDHIDGNPMDNRKQNLRVCTQAENVRNRHLGRNSTSGYKGVSYVKKSKDMINKRKKPWQVQIQKNGKTTYLGCVACKVEAARVYDRAALKYHGEFAKLNFPEDKEKYLRESLDDQ